DFIHLQELWEKHQLPEITKEEVVTRCRQLLQGITERRAMLQATIKQKDGKPVVSVFTAKTLAELDEAEPKVDLIAKAADKLTTAQRLQLEDLWTKYQPELDSM